MAQTTLAPTRPPASKQKTPARARSYGATAPTLPPADMQSLMTQLGAAAPNTTITGSSVGVLAPKR